MERPPGLDPAKLAENAKGLDELGYHEDARRLYGHACHWGYAPACAWLAQDHPAKPVAAAPHDSASKEKQPSAIAKAAPTPVPEKHTASLPPRTSPPTAPEERKVLSQPTPPAKTEQAIADVTPRHTPTPPSHTAHEQAKVDARKIGQQAKDLEQIGYQPLSIRLFKDACLAGDGEACKRLGEIYIQGSDGVERDYAASIGWYERARNLGVVVPTLEKRSVYR